MLMNLLCACVRGHNSSRKSGESSSMMLVICVRTLAAQKFHYWLLMSIWVHKYQSCWTFSGTVGWIECGLFWLESLRSFSWCIFCECYVVCSIDVELLVGCDRYCSDDKDEVFFFDSLVLFFLGFAYKDFCFSVTILNTNRLWKRKEIASLRKGIKRCKMEF